MNQKLTLIKNISCIITLKNAVSKNGKNLSPLDHSPIKHGAILHDGENIIWTGEEKTIPTTLSSQVHSEKDMKNRVVTPALVDAHTHLVFAGNRAQEYTQRLNGISYQTIAEAGGGITYSSSQTNQVSEQELMASASAHLQRLISLGHAAVEIKSGYSLTLEGEIKLCKIINQLKHDYKNKIHIHRTLMSAHAVPKGQSADQYVDEVVLPSITMAAEKKLIDSVDVFHEEVYFNAEQVKKILSRATQLGISKRMHVDEFNNNHGASLAAEFNCLSADHLLHTDKAGAEKLSISDTVAVLLPGTAFFLGKQLAPAKMLADAGCALAIASDFNPGSCHWNDVFQIARMSAPSLGLNIAQLWCAITLNAARALNLKNLGALVPGFSAKFLVWDLESADDLLYDWTRRPDCHFIS